MKRGEAGGRQLGKMKEHQKSTQVGQQHLSEAVTHQSLSVLFTIQSLPGLAAIALAQIAGLSPQTHLRGFKLCLGIKKRFEARKRRWSVSRLTGSRLDSITPTALYFGL